jgi:hypothetical protein
VPRMPEPGHRIWLASLASVLWLACFAALLVTRLSEWWPLFQPPISRTRLSLNEISVFLIAVFAPLTFLWLSVLIVIQRREQTVQRSTEESREALTAQQQAHQRTLAAMMCLTAAMNQTLQATRTTVVYDEFSLKLYFLAKDVLKEAGHVSVTVQPGMTVSLFRSPAHFDLNASQSSVDALFEQFENWLRHGVAAVLDGVSRIDTMDKQRTATFLGKIANLKSTISQLLDSYGTNPLATTRLEGIKLREIQQLLQTVEAKWVDQGHALGRVVRLS